MNWKGAQDLQRQAARRGAGGSVSHRDDGLLADECKKSNEALQPETCVRNTLNITVSH